MRLITLILIAMALLEVNILCSERKYAIYDGKTGLQLDMHTFVEKSKDYDVIFFGEFHDDSLIHIIQKEYLRELVRSSKFAVSMEMFERDVQDVLDSYLTGKISEEEFLKNSRPWNDYEQFYKALVEIAKANSLPVIASNIPRKYASQYINEGMTGINKLPQEERRFIAQNVNIKEDAYYRNFKKTMIENFGLEPDKELTPNQENNLVLYYGAQILKDETMAESIVDFLSKNKGYKVIHFNGDFHSNNYLGTVQKVLERNPDLKVAVITPQYVDKDSAVAFDTSLGNRCDFLIVLQNLPRPAMPKSMMGGHLSENYVAKHKIEVHMDPSKHEIEGLDIITFKYPVVKSVQLKYLGDLMIVKVTNRDKDLIYRVEGISDDSLYSSIVVYPNEGELFSINVEYKGTIYHSPEATMLNKRHSNSLGIISDAPGEGIYLPGGSFYPKTDKDMADFDIKALVPKEISIVTSGLMTYRSPMGDRVLYNYVSELPADEMTLVGGRYKILDSVYDGRMFSVYTFNESPTNMKYLGRIIEYYKIYNRLLGSYPYSSFKIVENFFATGFGMPGYTLLSNKLMAMPWIVLNPGSLAHEFVHSWWGNSVYVNYDYGNWCEGLTTFCSNYYFNVISKNKREEIDWRKKALISIETLPSEKNYPLIEFKYQNNNDDAVIGYSKGGFLFYELYKFFGEDYFFDALRTFHSNNKGKKASWMSLIAAFSMSSKKNKLDIPVSKIFDQWLKNKEIPTLKLANVKMNNDTIHFEIQQDGNFYMKVPVEFEINNETSIEYFTIKENSNLFSKKIEGQLQSIHIDPYYECLRKLNSWEIPYSFSRTLADKPLMILPTKKSKDYESALSFAKMIEESDYQIEYKSVDKLNEKDWSSRSLIVIGSAKSNPFFANVMSKLPANIKVSDSAFTIDGSRYEVKGNVLLLNTEHPKSQEKFVTLIYSDKLDSLDAFKRLFRYLSYSLVLLDKSKSAMPLTQKEIFPENRDKSELLYKNN